MAQWAQLQPHEDLPLFLSFTTLQTIAAIIVARTMQTIIVPMFLDIHASMAESPFNFILPQRSW